MSLVSAGCCEVEVSVTGGSLVQGRRTEWGGSQCHLENSAMRSCRVMGKGVEGKGVDCRAQYLQAEEMTANEGAINEIPLHLSGSVHLHTIQSQFSKSSFTQKIVFVNANLPETREKQTSINQRHKHKRMQ